MEVISVFDMFKIGIGPSSSHTLGPWKAAHAFIEELKTIVALENINEVQVDLYGSLALTGIGHGTDIAILLGLSGELPEIIELPKVQAIPLAIEREKKLWLDGKHEISFHYQHSMIFHFDKQLPFHPNGMKLAALNKAGDIVLASTYYSVGGGFITKGEELIEMDSTSIPPHHCETAKDLLDFCTSHHYTIAQMVMENERFWHSDKELHDGVWKIWNVMKESIYRGCHTEGTLPGGLNVTRRAATINRKLMGGNRYNDFHEWIDTIHDMECDFQTIMKWISCFAMAVNEENASFGRIVTAPTNGAAGVIPAVLMYYICFAHEHATKEDIIRFLLTASEIGALFKKKATISAAMGGCQAEIGVSSSMAAAALTECLGGSVKQALLAAEVAMEHHLGLTCDPIAGLVQVPCIERNTMGAVKAIMATNIALESDPDKAKVSLDAVVQTMWETAQDMNHKYKETSQGGLATNVRVAEC